MTSIWIEQLKDSIREDAIKILNNVNSRFSAQVRMYRDFYSKYEARFPDVFADWKYCIRSCVKMPEQYTFECYTSYHDFKSGALPRYAHRTFCGNFRLDNFNQAFFPVEDCVAVFLDSPNSPMLCTHVRYAQSKKEQGEWFYDKMNKHYTNYEFDYPAFSESYKGSPRFWKAPKTEECYGIELELLFPSFENKINFANGIKKYYKPWVCEKDGSLDGGSPVGPSLELIGPPLGIYELFDALDGIYKLIATHGGLEPLKNYALHITTNIQNSTVPEIHGARYMAIVNSVNHRHFWTKIAKRNNPYNRETGKYYANWLDFNDNDISQLMCRETWNYRWAEKPIDHYYATFLRKGGKSIETRIFKSSNDLNWVKAVLWLNYITWNYAKNDEPIELFLPFILRLIKNDPFLAPMRKMKSLFQ
jgi:hypothetical protein